MKLFRSTGGNSAFAQLALDDDANAMQESAASQFGEAVSDGVSKRVVMLTLLLLIIVPLFLPPTAEAKQPALDFLEVRT
eukprot:SAG11_NODE_665_length_7847_cov_13.635132_2_plen_79_part_00